MLPMVEVEVLVGTMPAGGMAGGGSPIAGRPMGGTAPKGCTPTIGETEAKGIPGAMGDTETMGAVAGKAGGAGWDRGRTGLTRNWLSERGVAAVAWKGFVAEADGAGAAAEPAAEWREKETGESL